MKYKKRLLYLLVIIGGISLYWYYNFPYYEQKAEERTAAYLKAQGVDSETVLEKETRKNKQGRWEVVYKFEDEPDIHYEYTYDRSADRMHLTVFHAPGSPYMSGGISIERGMEYAPLTYDDSNWVTFDEQGVPVNN